ncbi:PREDICTED: centrosomal protein of 78 kDa [Ceratosolen solmsi marchali]|uniref:Centrosomal protein of 78 kDa n=1 Tax=Ceratosolen solmsi marchali TaxID=326594 RepID=A0AAJ6VKW0_9HYME|nr:PREDICTED: centrosomal protein of 78 kDa [Ceratosolen solmsi marchali]
MKLISRLAGLISLAHQRRRTQSLGGPGTVMRTNMQATAEDHSFASSYMELCKKQRLRPLPMICVTLPYSLDFTTDRVKMDDWKPILNSLSFDRTLRSISVRSKFQCRKWLDQANSEPKARTVGKAPVVLTRYLLEWLSHSLGQCLRYSSALTTLELEGVPMPEDCLVALCVGLSNTKSLQHLSLQRCYIGDAGCEVICRAIADIPSVKCLNLSQCDLGPGAGPVLASALSRQKLNLYHDAWKESLRYREPKLESMPGLRRLTLNGNYKLGNEAAIGIIEAIGDSLWFKALDLQQCGLNHEIAKVVIDLLEHNKTIVIVDVRLNSGLRDESLGEIMKLLDRNNLRSENEYRWLSIPQKERGGVKRVSSATSFHKQKQLEQDSRPGPMRSKSAMIRQVKRPIAPIIFRKALTPVPQILKGMKSKSLPMFEKQRVCRQPMKPLERTQPRQVEAVPKVSLHLDLLAQIRSLDEPAQMKEPPIKEVVMKSEPSVEDAAHSEQRDRQLQEILAELIGIRKERDELEEEIRRNNLLLAEERASREFAEQKLESVMCDLTELKETLQQRDRDTRGYFLMSQKSMDEISYTFGRLMRMLEATSRRAEDSLEALDQEEDNVARDDIRRRFALIIRKTKSENLKKGYFVDEHAVLSRLQMTARYGRSESNICTTIEPLGPMMRMERHIGDTTETIRLPELMANYQGQQLSHARIAGNSKELSGERARAIFASIIQGGSPISLNAHM